MSNKTKTPGYKAEIMLLLKQRMMFTRAEIAAETGVPKWAHTLILDELFADGTVRVVGRVGNSDLLSLFATHDSGRIAIASPDDFNRLMAFMKSHRKFTRHEFHSVENVSGVAVRRVFTELKTSGILRQVGKSGNLPLYSIYSQEAELKGKADQRLSKEGRMWTAIRIFKVFTPQDLEISLAGTDEPIKPADIQKYCSVLVRAGFLRTLLKAIPGKRPARYQLVRNSGPLPPVRKRVTVVFDPNRECIIQPEGSAA